MNNVDTKVVEMQFNNKDFEQNVATSLSTIDRLKNALNFGKQSKGLTQLQNSTNAVDFSPFTGALDAVQNKFSLLGTIGDQVLRNLTTSLMTSTKNILTAIPRQISQGGLNRALNIEQAKFMLEGLKVEWDKIEKDISYGVQDTAYGLDAAAKAASQLVASGVEFGDTFGETGNSPMAKALRGISGVAAMTNSSYEEISSIFTTVAGQGKLMTMQLRQMEARGLNAAAQMGQVMGKTEEEIRDMVTKGKIDFKTFSEAMDKAFGDQAKKANETYTGALSNVKAALSRIGAEFKASRIENLRQIFVAAIPVINTIKKSMAGLVTVINGMSTAIKDKVVKALSIFDPEKGGSGVKGIELFMKMLENLATVVSKVAGVFSKAFGNIMLDSNSIKSFISSNFGIKDLSQFFEVLVSLITISDASLNKLYRVLTNVFAMFSSVGRLGIHLFVNLVKIGKALLETVSPLFGPLSTIFIKLTGHVGNLADILSAVSDALTNGIIKVIKGATPVIQLFSNIITGLVGTFKGIAQGISDISSYVKTEFGGVVKDVDKVGDSFNYILGTVKKVAQVLGTFIAELFDSLAIPFKANDTNYVLGFLNSMMTALTALLSVRTISAIKQVESLATNFKGILSALKAPFWDLSIALKGLQTGIKAGALKKIATALLELAVAMLILSKIDTESMVKSLSALTAMLYELVVATKALIAMSDGAGFLKLYGFSQIIRALGTSMLLMAIAVKILSSTDWAGLAKGLVGIGIMLTEVGVFMKATSSIGGKSAKSFAGVAISLLIMARALEMLGKLSWKQIVKGLGAMAGVLLSISAFSRMVSSKGMAQVGVSMLLISSSMLIFSKALESIGKLGIKQIVKGLIGLSGALIAVAVAMKLMPSAGAIGSGLGILVVAEAMTILAKAMESMGKMSIKEIAKSLAVMAGALIEIVLAMNLAQSGLAGAAAVFVMANALVVISKAILAFGNMDLSQIGKGLLVMAGALGILIGAGALAGMVAPGLLALSVAIIAIGAGTLAAGAGIALMASGLSLLVATASTGLSVIITLLEGVISLLPEFLEQLGVAFIAFLDVLANSYDSLVQFGITILTATMDGIIQTLPKFIELLGTLIDALRTVVLNHGPKIIDTGVRLILLFLDGITRAMPKLTDKAFKVVISFINGMADAIRNNGDALKQAFINLIESILEFLGINVTEFISKGEDLLEGVKQGFTNVKDSVINFVGNIIESIKQRIEGFKEKFASAGAWLMQGLRNGLSRVPIIGTVINIADRMNQAFRNRQQISSPSKVWKQYGIYITEGLAIGLTKGRKRVKKSLNKLISAFDINGMYVTFFKNSRAEVNKQITNLINTGAKSFKGAGKVLWQYIHDYTKASQKRDGTYSRSTKYFKAARHSLENFTISLYKNSNAYKQSVANVKSYNKQIAKEQANYKELRKTYAEQTKSYNAAVQERKKKLKELTTAYNKQKAAYDKLNDKSELTDAEKAEKKRLNTRLTALNKEQNAYDTASQKRVNTLKQEVSDTKKEMQTSLSNIRDYNNQLKKELKSIYNGPKSVYQEYRQSIRETIKGTADLLKVSVTNYVDSFQKMETVEKVSVKELLGNMQSQIRGISKWRSDLNKLANRGLASGIIDKLREMGPESEKYIQAFLNMSKKSLRDANTMFKAEGELTARTLIDNMKQQNQLVNTWSQNITKLAKRGVGYHLLKDLVDQGPENSEYVQTLANMTEAQLAQVNRLYVKSGQLPSNVADNVLAALSLSLRKTDKKQLAKASASTTSAISKVLKMSYDSTEKDAKTTGTKVVKALSKGIKSAQPEILEASKTIGDSALNQFKTYFSTKKGTTVAIQMTNGLVTGLTTGKTAVRDAARALAKTAYNAATSELQIHSPSKKMEDVGRFSVLGLANGLTKYAGLVNDSASILADSTYDTIRESLAKVYSYIDSEIDQPVIKPTLDLSDVERNAGRLGDMLGSGQIGVNGANGEIQNGKVFNFTQNNYSPKALSRIDIYRQTKNQVSVVKGLVGKK